MNNKSFEKNNLLNKKIIIKRVGLISILLLVLLISSCTPKTPFIEDYHTGTEGLVLSFVDNTPPAKVFEEETIPINMKLANLGAKSVPLDKVLFKLRGDSFYTNVPDNKLSDVIDDSFFANADNTASNNFLDSFVKEGQNYVLRTINGKSYSYPEGETAWLYPFAETKKIKGTREQPETELFGEICYPYETDLSTSICVDVNPYDEDKRAQVCEAKKLVFQDQGAPISILSVDNIPQFVNRAEPGGRGFVRLVKPVFEIEISNKGSGVIVTDSIKGEGYQGLEDTCGMNIPLQEINRFNIEASLSGIKLDCIPEKPYLKGKSVIVKCEMKLDDVQLTTHNYFDELQINVSYIYKDVISTSFEIMRRFRENNDDSNQDSLTYSEQDANPAYVNGALRCGYCDDNPNSDDCEGWPSNAQEVKKKYGFNFECACSQKTCYELAASGACVVGSTWCPGSNYCCVPDFKNKVDAWTQAQKTTSTTTSTGG